MVPTYFCPWTLNLHIAIVLLRLRVHYSLEIKRCKSQTRIKVVEDPLLSPTEHVTWRRQPKRNFDDLVPDYVPYKPRYIGNVLFNGKLIKANANYGCFMTMNTVNRDIRHIPENIKVSFTDKLVSSWQAIEESLMDH